MIRALKLSVIPSMALATVVLLSAASPSHAAPHGRTAGAAARTIGHAPRNAHHYHYGYRPLYPYQPGWRYPVYPRRVVRILPYPIDYPIELRCHLSCVFPCS